MQPSAIGSETFVVDPTQDGGPCDRLGMRLTTSGNTFFGGIAGTEDRVSSVSAVGRADGGNTELRALNLLVLERHDCDALTVGGNNTTLIVANPIDDPATPLVDESQRPGIVAVDSDASGCTGSNDTVEVNGNGARIISQGPCEDLSQPANSCGEIDLFAQLNDPTCAAATDGSQFACDEGQGTIAPDARQSLGIFGRAPVDHRYNCKTSYATAPWFVDQPIDGCPGASSTTDYVDELRAFATTAASTQFTVVPSAAVPGSACNSGTITYPPGNYYVNCPTFRVNSGAVVTFTGGNVVFAGKVAVQNNSSLTINACAGSSPPTCPDTMTWTPGANFDERQSSSEGAWAYVDGQVSVAGSGVLRLIHTALFIGPGGDVAQSGTIISSAPDEGSTPGSAGPFDDLGLWSDGTTAHTFRGGGANDFQGLYFGGRAHFAMSGGTTVDLRSAQFVSNTMAFSGGVTFTMSPVGDRSVLYEVPASHSLIR